MEETKIRNGMWRSYVGASVVFTYVPTREGEWERVRTDGDHITEIKTVRSVPAAFATRVTFQ